MKDIHESLIWFPDRFNNHNKRLQSAIADGRKVPEELLPGRLLMAMHPDHRARLANTDWKNVAPWWVKVMCS